MRRIRGMSAFVLFVIRAIFLWLLMAFAFVAWVLAHSGLNERPWASPSAGTAKTSSRSCCSCHFVISRFGGRNCELRNTPALRSARHENVSH